MRSPDSSRGAYAFLERRWLWLPLLLAALAIGGVLLVWVRSVSHRPQTPVQILLQPLRDADRGNWFTVMLYEVFHVGDRPALTATGPSRDWWRWDRRRYRS